MAGAQLTLKEQEKVTVLTLAIEGRITNDQAARQLRLSVRQVQRAKAAIRSNGSVSIVHGLKRKSGNHKIRQEMKEETLEIIKQSYPDFAPTFAAEKLAENHFIHISHETLRLWMMEEGLWKSRKQKKGDYRSWRPRKEYYGELQQFDGSYHHWFEDRFLDSNGEPIEALFTCKY